MTRRVRELHENLSDATEFMARYQRGLMAGADDGPELAREVADAMLDGKIARQRDKVRELHYGRGKAKKTTTGKGRNKRTTYAPAEEAPAGDVVPRSTNDKSSRTSRRTGRRISRRMNGRSMPASTS